MSLPFYFDQHVPAAIGRALRLRGVEVLTAYEDGSDRLAPAGRRGRKYWGVQSAGGCVD